MTRTDRYGDLLIDNLLNPNNTGDLVLEFPILKWLFSFFTREVLFIF
ncbi:MAG: hypothetical protein N3A01_01125 [Bacteroidales bacterium]|nr:hypothetical protein [Bacteroidales bacterium]